MDFLNKLNGKLKLYKFIFRFKIENDIQLPQFKGSMLRGAFGAAFKSTVCITKYKTCDKCLIKNQCSYFTIFETELDNNNLWFLNGIKKFPHPFIIHAPEQDKTFYKKDENFDIGLTILPKYSLMLPYFILTFQKMGEMGISAKRHKIKLKKAFSISNNGTDTIYDADSNFFKENFNPYLINMNNHKTEKIKLNFTTPLRIQDKSSLIYESEKITSEVIVRAVIRRVLAVLNLFYNIPVPDNIPDFLDIKISQNNLTYQKILRFSNRQNKKMEFGGFLGSILLEGKNIYDFLPFVLLASNFNIGKNTAFGYGEFNVEFL